MFRVMNGVFPSADNLKTWRSGHKLEATSLREIVCVPDVPKKCLFSYLLRQRLDARLLLHVCPFAFLP